MNNQIQDKPTVMYVHGLSSSGNSHTAKCLREELKECRVLSPDVPVHPAEALKLLRQLCEQEHVDVVVGTSMGGMYAHQMYGYPRIIVNPGFHLSELLQKELGSAATVKLPFFSQRQDGATEFEVNVELIREFEEMEAHQFEGIANDPTPEDHIHALFADNDYVVNCREEFQERCRGIISSFHGVHRLDENNTRQHVVPLIRQLLSQKH